MDFFLFGTKRCHYFGGGATRQDIGVDVLPDISTAIKSASPLSVIFQSITPAPGLTFGWRPGACTSLIFVPLAYGPATKLLPESWMKICGFGSTRSVAVSS